MSLLIESIKILNGRLYNIERHELRLNNSRKVSISKHVKPIHLSDHIIIPPEFQTGLVKCRILYGLGIEEVNFESYKRKEINKVKLAYHDHIDYSLKYADRKSINELYQQRGDSDDIIIVKKGMITDSSYANIALYQDKKWYTPAQPLLEGTRRAQLLSRDQIKLRHIAVQDIFDYTKISFFNAMIGLGQLVLDINRDTIIDG